MSWLASLPNSDWWEFYLAFFAATFGALAGGIPSYLLAVRTSREALAKERDERARTQHDRVFRTFLTVSECLADSVDHIREIERQIAENRFATPQDFPISSAVQPIANLKFIGKFKIKSDDLLVFVEGGEIEFAQNIRHKIKQYNSIIECLTKFTELKENFSSFLSEESRLSISTDGTVQGEVPVSVAERLNAKRAQMESIIVPTRMHLRETVSDLAKIAAMFGAKAKACTPDGLQVVAFQEVDMIELEQEIEQLPTA